MNKPPQQNKKYWTGDLTIGLGWVYYEGPLGQTELHSHYALQLCFPLSTPLQIETPDKDLTTRKPFAIGPSVKHRLTGTSTARLLYLDPNMTSEECSRLNIEGIESLSINATIVDILDRRLRASAAHLPDKFIREALSLIWPAFASAPRKSIDARISRTLAKLSEADDLNLSLTQLLKGSGLSESRFRHLFRDQVGLSVKNFLLWSKVQRAIQLLTDAPSLTHAAHGAGFADSAHLSRTFKRTFGLTPSDIFKNAHFTDKKTGI